MRRLRATTTQYVQSSPDVRCDGPAAVRHGVKVEFGRLALTDDVLTFTGDETLSVPVANIAWVEAGQRSRELTLEITSRQAQIHRFFITDVRWVQAVREACADLIKLQVEPARMVAAG